MFGLILSLSRKRLTSELQPALARRVGQRLDAAVVLVMPAVEGRLGDALGLGLFGDLLADRDRPLEIAALGRLVAFLYGHAARGPQGHALAVVDELGVDVLVAAKDGQPRPRRRAVNPAADVLPSPQLLQALRLLMVHDSLPFRPTIADREPFSRERRP